MEESAQDVVGAANARGSRANTNSQRSSPQKSSSPDRLELERGMQDRIDALGREEARKVHHTLLLWLSITFDLVGKALLVRELARLGRAHQWQFMFTAIGFFSVSSLFTAAFWLGLYPKAASEPDQSKKARRRVVRCFGGLFASIQLGTVFCATRALFTRKKSRIMEMDFRGMRLTETTFLTLPMAAFQVFAALNGRGLGPFVLLSIFASVTSVTICHASLDLRGPPTADATMRQWWEARKGHLIQLGTFIVQRVFEIGARITSLALFVWATRQYCFVLLAFHAFSVLLLASFNQKVWGQLKELFKRPAMKDLNLLMMCLIYPPSCYIADATDRSGLYWWRARMCPRLSFSSPSFSRCIIPFPAYVGLVVLEHSGCIVTSYVLNDGSSKAASNLIVVSSILNFVWISTALSYVATCAGEGVPILGRESSPSPQQQEQQQKENNGNVRRSLFIDISAMDGVRGPLTSRDDNREETEFSPAHEECGEPKTTTGATMAWVPPPWMPCEENNV